jgi:hypothetical protein
MHWQLLWAGLGGLLIGLLGEPAVPGRRPLLRPLGPLLGVGCALGGHAAAVAVPGPDHRTVSLVVAVAIAAIVVCFSSACVRLRTLARNGSQSRPRACRSTSASPARRRCTNASRSAVR